MLKTIVGGIAGIAIKSKMKKTKQVYLDNAATTKVEPRVAKVMNTYLSKKYGNASSLHQKGQEARKAVEEARHIIARSINAKPEEIIFTSGGTESNNLALKGLYFENKNKKHIITTKIEHESILEVCRWLEKQGCKVSYLNVDKEGFVNPKDVEKAITPETLVVSIIHGNNEIGTLQNIEEIGKICRSKGVYFHVDACQAFTKTKIDIIKQNIDLLTLNGHKIHGPKGVGALFKREGIKITPILHGGGHEKGLRSGTENVAGIVGFAEAVRIAKESDIRKMKNLRDYLIKEIMKIPNTKLNGPAGKNLEHRLCNNINVSFKNIDGEALLSSLDENGIFVSTGSACASHRLERSHVLKAIGLNDREINSAIRISISKFTTKEELEYFIKVLNVIVKKLRQISPFV